MPEELVLFGLEKWQLKVLKIFEGRSLRRWISPGLIISHDATMFPIRNQYLPNSFSSNTRGNRMPPFDMVLSVVMAMQYSESGFSAIRGLDVLSAPLKIQLGLMGTR